MVSAHYVTAKQLAGLSTSHHLVTLPSGVIWSLFITELLMGVNF